MKFFVFVILVGAVTCVGLLVAAYGAVKYESTGQYNILLLAGKILLWPWLLWCFLVESLSPTSIEHGYLSIILSQFLGYLLMVMLYSRSRNYLTNKLAKLDKPPSAPS